VLAPRSGGLRRLRPIAVLFTTWFSGLFTQLTILVLFLITALVLPTVAQSLKPLVAAPDSLSSQVDTAMAGARVDDFVPFQKLLKRGDEVLPYLEKYTDNATGGAYFVLSTFIRRGHSAEAVKLLSLLLAHDQEASVDVLYYSYTPREIKQWGGPALKQNLFQFLRKVSVTNGPAYSRAIMMLTVFSPDPKVRHFLEDMLAHSFSGIERTYYNGMPVDRQVKKRALLPCAGNPTDLTLPVDLALSEEGDQSAFQRVSKSINGTDVEGSIVFILRATRFLHQKPVLRQILALIRDKRPSGVQYKMIIMTDAHPSPTKAAAPLVPKDDSLRLCDLAVATLAENTGVDVGIPDLMLAIKESPRTLPTRLYSDAELEKAYRVLKAALL